LLKVGIFHWSFEASGGGEEVVYNVAKALGINRIYTFNSCGWKRDGVEAVDVYEYLPSWLRRITGVGGKLLGNRFVRFFDYWAWEMFDVTDVGDFDVIITSGQVTRAIIPPDNTMKVHIEYTPMRWLWSDFHSVWKSKGRIMRVFVISELHRLNDLMAAKRVDHYISISELVSWRLKHYHGVTPSLLLYPPIHTSHYHHSPPEPFLLHIGRLDKAKNILPVIQACIQTKTKLILIGPPGDDDLTRYFNHPLIEYRGYVPIEEKLDLLSRCKAVIYNPINEDFGIVPCEALASGKPVIVNDTGYPPYIVRKTGVLGRDGAFTLCKGGIIYPLKMGVDGLAKAIKLLDRLEVNPDYLREHAKMYDFNVFKEKLTTHLNKWLEEWREM